MGKLQPNFSWQKYENNFEDAKEQFQFQLQNEHVQTSNAVNSTIDDLSFFTRERQTSFVWVNGKPVWTKSLATAAWTAAGTINTIPLGITGDFLVVDMVCCISDGTTSTNTTLLLPNLDTAVAANEVSIIRIGTDVILTSGGTDRSAFSGYVTVYFIRS